jgi:hypothetical protein
MTHLLEFSGDRIAFASELGIQRQLHNTNNMHSAICEILEELV